MKINKGFLWLMAIIILLVLLKIFVIGSNEPAAAVKKSNSGPIAVNATVVAATGLEELIHTSGTIMAEEEAMLTPEVSGRITKLYFKEGSSVQKGDLLVKLNDGELAAQQRKLQSQLKLQTEKSERLKKLLDINGISREEYDVAQNELATLQADIDYVSSQIDKTEIRAPFSGKVGLRYVSEGATVMTGDKIASIQQIDKVKIEFSIPEKYAGEVLPGDDIRFTIDGSKDIFRGTIYAAEPKIDPSTRTYRLRASCMNKDGKLFSGAFANIELVLKHDSSAMLIPTQAIIPILKGKKVFICKNGVAKSRNVVTGTRTEIQVEITSGLNVGDTVLTTGLLQVRDGSPVSVTVDKWNQLVK